MENTKRKLQIIKGIRVPHTFKPEFLKEIIDYKPNPDDVFIVTYPKSGTTWMQIVALHIFRKGKELEDYADFKTVCPFIEARGLNGITNMPRPGAFKTHLPYNLMPYSAEAKYIFVLRNPKDTCVSLHYHSTKGSQPFDEFFELFMAGEVEANDYFDHLKSWYPHRNDKGVFHSTYEDMKEDLKSVVIRLASFLGQEYAEAIEKDNNVLNNILRFSGFEHMKKNLLTNFESARPQELEFKDGDGIKMKASEPDDIQPRICPGLSKAHFRKGIVGDWRNHFSEEQSERLNQKFFDRFGGTELYEKYKPFL